MRIPFPERVSYSHAFVFAVVLCGVQLFQHTNPAFSGIVFCFIMVAAAAFNLAGGMYMPSGAFVGVNAVMTLVLPMVSKVLLGEAGDRNLHTPLKTIEAYFAGMVALLIAAAVTRRFRTRKAFLADMLPESDLAPAYRGCVVFAFVIGFLTNVAAGGGAGSIGSFLNQVNKFPALAYVLGVVATVHFSRGRRSMTLPLLALILWAASSGLFTFSKEAFLSPFFCWVVGAAYMGYRLSWINVVMFAAGLFVAVTYMVPYAQVGRGLESTGRGAAEVSAYMLRHMDEVRESYQADVNSQQGAYHDYDHPISLLDRLDVLAIDDGLIETTDRAGFFGYTPIKYSFYNFVPHILWASKPQVFFGNVYGREVGVLGEEDYGTGISFSYASDAYHEGGFFCLFCICPLLFSLIFVVLDSVVGDSRRNPVTLIMTVLIFRAASEGNLTVAINLIYQPLIATVLVAYVATYMLPVVGRLLGKSDAGETGLTAPEPIASL